LTQQSRGSRTAPGAIVEIALGLTRVIGPSAIGSAGALLSRTPGGSDDTIEGNAMTDESDGNAPSA